MVPCIFGRIDWRLLIMLAMLTVLGCPKTKPPAPVLVGPAPEVVEALERFFEVLVVDEDGRSRVRVAIEAGADYLVVGRPITRADDPAAALKELAHELGP